MKELLEFDDHVFAQDEGMKDLFPTYHNPYKFNFLNKLWFEYEYRFILLIWSIVWFPCPTLH